MQLQNSQHGGSTFGFILTCLAVVAVVILGANFFSGGSAAHAATAAQGDGFIAGVFAFVALVLAGGWLFAAGLSTLALTGLWFACFVLPFAFLIFLSDRGDPCANWWWEADERDEAESREIVVSMIYVFMLVALQFGGVPIWQTLAHPTITMPFLGWGIPDGVFILPVWLAVGVLWAFFKRWDDLGAYLHRKRTRVLHELVKDLHETMEELLNVRASLYSALKLGHGEKIETEMTDRQIVEKMEGNMAVAERVKSELQRAVQLENSLLKLARMPDGGKFTEITGDMLGRMFKLTDANSTPVSCAPEFADHIGKKLEPYSVDIMDHKGCVNTFV